MAFVTVKEASERWGKTEKTIKEWAKTGKLKSFGKGMTLTISDEGMPELKQKPRDIKVPEVKESDDIIKAKETLELSKLMAEDAKYKADEAESKQKIILIDNDVNDIKELKEKLADEINQINKQKNNYKQELDNLSRKAEELSAKEEYVNSQSDKVEHILQAESTLKSREIECKKREDNIKTKESEYSNKIMLLEQKLDTVNKEIISKDVIINNIKADLKIIGCNKCKVLLEYPESDLAGLLHNDS